MMMNEFCGVYSVNAQEAARSRSSTLPPKVKPKPKPNGQVPPAHSQVMNGKIQNDCPIDVQPPSSIELVHLTLPNCVLPYVHVLLSVLDYMYTG